MLTGARRDEIASLRWSEVDQEAATITLAPNRTKNKREHVGGLRTRRSPSWPARPASSESRVRPLRPHRTPKLVDRQTRARRANRPTAGALDAARLPAVAVDVPARALRRAAARGRRPCSGTRRHKAGVAGGTYNRAIYLDERRRVLERWGAHLEWCWSVSRSRRKSCDCEGKADGPAASAAIIVVPLVNRVLNENRQGRRGCSRTPPQPLIPTHGRPWPRSPTIFSTDEWRLLHDEYLSCSRRASGGQSRRSYYAAWPSRAFAGAAGGWSSSLETAIMLVKFSGFTTAFIDA